MRAARAHAAPAAQHRAGEDTVLDTELSQCRQSVRPQTDARTTRQVSTTFEHADVPAVLFEPGGRREAPDSCSDNYGMSLRHQASFPCSDLAKRC